MEKLIFIGGCPRSGTSLVQKILDNHHEIDGGPEFDNLPSIINIYHTLNEGIVNGRQSIYYNELLLKKSIRELIDKLLINQEKDIKYTSEKTPDNIFVFEDLNELYPSAKFIVTIRDPRAILYSFEQVQKKSKSLNQELISFGANLFLDLYRINKSFKQIEKLFNKDLFEIYSLQYELLVNKPEHTVKNLCKYLEVYYTEEMLNTSKDNTSRTLFENSSISPFITDSFSQDINIGSVDKWKNEMSRSKSNICSFYFKRKKYKILESYNFEINYILLLFSIPYQLLLLIGFIIKLSILYPKKVLKYVAKNY